MPRARLEAERPQRIDVPFPGGESWREAVQRHAASSASWPAKVEQRVLLIGHVATRWALDHLLNGVAARTARRRAVRVARGLGVRAR